ncbi:MAG: membrane integrity-associated transporter subunit PqiC [Verrucomicrobiaceae bacterium]|nr:MAG: membrane integrity-associated transporter subunit PqiC [Verrucomicrobiaceae bacterium]
MRFPVPFVFLLVPPLLAASCASPQKHFYMLTAEGPPPSGAAAGTGTGIGVGPVSVAGYLDRPNLVFQETDNQLAISESNRWAGDLAENITRVTAANLGHILGTGNVRVYPWDSDAGLNYQVSLDILHLHGGTDGNAVLDASWRVYALPSRQLAASRSWSGTEPMRKDGYSELAAAQSRLLARLAREIAAGMR